MSAAGLVLRIDGRAEQNAVAVGSRCPDNTVVEHPAADGLALVLLVHNESRIATRQAEYSFDVQPLRALAEQNQFPPAFDLRELARTRVGRQVDHRFADQGAA